MLGELGEKKKEKKKPRFITGAHADLVNVGGEQGTTALSNNLTEEYYRTEARLINDLPLLQRARGIQLVFIGGRYDRASCGFVTLLVLQLPWSLQFPASLVRTCIHV